METDITIPWDFKQIGLLVFFGGLQAIIYALVYQGFEKGQLAVLSPLFATYSGIASLFSVVVLGEVMEGPLFIALGVVFIGIVLINLDMHALRNRQFGIVGVLGLKEVGFAAVLAAFWTVYWDTFISGKDGLTYALWMYICMALTAWIIARWQKADLSVRQPGLWKFFGLIGACEVIAYLAISAGFSMTSYLSVVAILSSAFSLPAMMLAYLFLKEKVNVLQITGGMVIVAGIVLLSLF